MKRLTSIVMAVMLTFIVTSCNDCSLVQDAGNPDRQFRLLDAQGNDLWFGDSATYDPNAAVFEHETKGVLTSNLNASNRSVGVMIPLTNNDEDKIFVHLDSAGTEVLRYVSFAYERKCEVEYELSYMFQNDVKICSLCGSTELGGSIYINLVK
ncbi:hypothetical protein [Owenweeksia hongkongensis]|uniref:hypothetical protein n=1 Tax=Owenweeksia hongkongensis TaxID=253245 RepID=UPI003A93759B